MGMLMFSMCAISGGSGTVLAPAEALFVPPGHAGDSGEPLVVR